MSNPLNIPLKQDPCPDHPFDLNYNILLCYGSIPKCTNHFVASKDDKL
jgi:hypothetical protein